MGWRCYLRKMKVSFRLWERGKFLFIFIFFALMAILTLIAQIYSKHLELSWDLTCGA